MASDAGAGEILRGVKTVGATPPAIKANGDGRHTVPRMIDGANVVAASVLVDGLAM